MNDEEKRRQLEALAEEIHVELGDQVWLFDQNDKVQGFLGTSSDVMFVAERPSMARTPKGPGGSFLYPLLEATGNGNAHVTDVIKIRGKNGDPYPDDLAPHKRFLERELDIVQPRLIIAFGQKVYDLLVFALAERGIPIKRVYHYSAGGRWPKRKLECERQIREALPGKPNS